MGHPAAPLQLLLLLLLCSTTPVTPVTPSTPCFSMPSSASAKLDLSNNSYRCTELDFSLFQRQVQLLLCNNSIEVLSPSSRIGPALEELDLSYNQLQVLPAAVFSNATALKILRLEGNPLRSVPPAAFQGSLQLLVVPCRCDVVGSILAHCACSRSPCPKLECQCRTSPDELFNVTGFHARECGSRLGLVAGLAGAAGGVAVLLVVVAMVCHWRRRVTTDVAGVGWAKREPTMPHGQPRYVSRANEIDAANASAAPDYENVFVSPRTAPATSQVWTPGWQEEHESPQVLADDNYFLDSEAVAGDQPIYANTQDPGEDVYIIPDRG